MCFSADSVAPSMPVGTLRLLKSQCDGTGESRQKARRKLERSLVPNAQVTADARRAHFNCCAHFHDAAGCFDSPCIVTISSVIKKKRDIYIGVIDLAPTCGSEPRVDEVRAAVAYLTQTPGARKNLLMYAFVGDSRFSIL